MEVDRLFVWLILLGNKEFLYIEYFVIIGIWVVDGFYYGVLLCGWYGLNGMMLYLIDVISIKKK